MSLPDFEGKQVDSSAIRIAKAGDGLSAALKFEPVALHLDDEVFFVLRGVVAQVNHKPDGKDAEELVRLHTVDTAQITMVPAEAVADMLAEAAEKLRLQEEEHAAAEQARLEEEERAALEAEQREAGILTFDDAGGDPDEDPIPPPATDEELAAAARADREATDELEAARSKRRAKEA